MRAHPAAGAGTAPGADGEGGRLFVVATPIGNLGDMTLRAIEILRSVPLVAAEDTRLSRRLFIRHEIETRLISYHARNATSRLPELIEHLRGGADLALITDAGTPAVSDPGADLVRAWAAEGGRVVPIPGASAVLAAVVGSGVAGPRWAFEGFLPRSGRERRERIAALAADPRATVLFESPQRVAATLADLAAACGADRPGAICRELTKIHEEFVRGSLAELADRARTGSLTLRGEFVLVVGERHGNVDAGAGSAAGAGAGAGVGATSVALDGMAPLTAARAEVARLVAEGMARGAAARTVSAATGIARRQLYGAPDAG